MFELQRLLNFFRKIMSKYKISQTNIHKTINEIENGVSKLNVAVVKKITNLHNVMTFSKTKRFDTEKIGH